MNDLLDLISTAYKMKHEFEQSKAYRLKLPPVNDLKQLIIAVKKDISDEYRAFEDDDIPGIQLTIGWEPNGEWSYQTGDNSYSGSAYHYPYWAVVGVYRRSNSLELARDLQQQLSEQIP